MPDYLRDSTAWSHDDDLEYRGSLLTQEACHPVSPNQQYNALAAPPPANRGRCGRRRSGRSSLNPNAPEFTSCGSSSLDLNALETSSPAAVSRQESPSRDLIRWLIAAKETERKGTLEFLTSVKAQLDDAMARLVHGLEPGDMPDPTGLYVDEVMEYYMKQQIIEFELSLDNAGRAFLALGEEIEELWGELAVAQW
ncbi:MAG: hypothetical protein Q9195_001728 [Heterodermia aff. obscurata]